MPSKQRPADGTGRPTPREAIARVSAAAAPAVARAQAKAAPGVEKATVRASSLFGQIKSRAKDTARGFSEGYKADGDSGANKPTAPVNQPGEDGSPRPRPRPS